MKKQILCLTILSALLLTACQAQHDPVPGDDSKKTQKPEAEVERLHAATYLRKLSLHLRGTTPTQAEYRDLEQATKNKNEQHYLQSRIQHYLSTEEHALKMMQRLEELFFLKTHGVTKDPNYVPVEDGYNQSGQESYVLNNSLNALFYDLAHRNLSWDHLLTGKEYKAYPKSKNALDDSLYLSDLDFFAAVSNTGQWNQERPMHLSFSPADSRIAGALTTSRFFNRYVNTALNKNRKRAAAVFRIFLCDDMKAVVVDEKGNQDEIFDRVFPDADANEPMALKELNDESRHGSDPACMKCHYKLDPMGQAFQLSGLILSPSFSKGGLVFKNSSGKKVESYGQGIGTVAKAITKQPEYVSCQVQHFWDWFIGTDVELDQQTEKELITAFEQNHRRTNDFIAYLVQRPEFGFGEPAQDLPEAALRAKVVLKNCNGCHRNEGNIPSFTKWPIGGSKSSHDTWVKKIWKSLDLANGGAKRSMPPKTSVWQPDSEELKRIQTWIQKGADHE